MKVLPDFLDLLLQCGRNEDVSKPCVPDVDDASGQKLPVDAAEQRFSKRVSIALLFEEQVECCVHFGRVSLRRELEDPGSLLLVQVELCGAEDDCGEPDEDHGLCPKPSLLAPVRNLVLDLLPVMTEK